MKGLIVALVLLLATVSYAADVRLTWDAPTTNEDGTPLTDLAGYKIYWGGVSRGINTAPPTGYPATNVRDVGNVVTYTMTGFTDGDWWFSVTAYDTSGNESRYSNEVKKSIDTRKPNAPTNLR